MISLSPDDAMKLARIDSEALWRAIRAGALSPGRLSIVAERLGQEWPQVRGAYQMLHELLAHPSPIVREGAIYGLAALVEPDGPDADTRERFKAIAVSDSSPGVRAAAREEFEP